MLRSTWHGLTLRGRTFLLVGVVGMPIALVRGQRDLAWLGALLLVLPLVALLLVLAGSRRLHLEVERSVSPVRAALGESLSGHLVVRRAGMLPLALARCEDLVPSQLGRRPRFVVHRLHGGWQREVAYPLLALVRGRHQVGPLRVHCSDAFGLVDHPVDVGGSTEVLVLPQVHPLGTLPGTGGAGTSGDTAPQSIGRTGQDDVLVREYQPGDDVRRVHWRSSARWDQLMVRREEQAWEPAVTVLLDNRADRHRGVGRASSFEWSVSAAASLCAHFARAGYRVSLVDADQTVVSAGTQDAETTREACLLALAGQRTTTSTTLDRAIAASRATRDGAVVIAVLTSPDPSDLAVLAGVRRAHSQGLALLLDPAATPTQDNTTQDNTTQDTASPGAPATRTPPSGRATTVGSDDDAMLARLHELRWRAVQVTTSTPIDEAWSLLTRGVVA